MSAHTPGPWVVESDDGVDFNVQQVNGPTRVAVEVSERDAQLIAAAPDLLDALNECLAWMESLRASGDAGYWDWHDDEYTKGCAAIDKATRNTL